VSSLTGDGADADAALDSFFACPIGALVAVPGAALVVVDGRALVVVLVEEASDARGVARVVEASAAGRVVRGRFAVVVEGARDCLELVVVFPGDARVAAAAVPGVLRTAVAFLFSSPEVTEDRSGSASDAVALELIPGLLAAVPGTGRVGGLFRLDPTVLTRDVELVAGLDAVVEARAVLVDVVGRRAPTVAVLLAVVGRRGGTASLLAEEPALEAILRRTDDVGVEGAGNFFRRGVLGGPSWSLAGVGTSMVGWICLRGRRYARLRPQV
jgi:hypothetical protein